MDDYTKHIIKSHRSNALAGDLVTIVIFSFIIYLFFFHNFMGVSEPACVTTPAQSAFKTVDMLESMGTFLKQQCAIEQTLRLLWVFVLLYFVLCISLVCSPFKATFGSYCNGIYFSNECGERPSLRQATLLVLGNVSIFPILLMALYWKITGAHINLHSIGCTLFVFYGLTAFIQLYDAILNNSLVWNERISGLQTQFSDKKRVQIEKSASKKKGWYKYIAKKAFFIGLFFVAALWGFVTINILREGAAPANYNEYLYDRNNPDWQNNAYFALAGLDAPLDVSDFYEYGRQESIYHARVFSNVKSEVDLPYDQAIPRDQLSVYDPQAVNKDEYGASHIQLLGFDKVENWDCLINMRARTNATFCPAASSVLGLIDQNQVIWHRFKSLADHQNFSVPDVSISNIINSHVLIQFSKIHSVHILDLLSHGEKKNAVNEWIKYTNLYKKMASSSSNISNKAMFVLLLKEKLRLLEVMLNLDPSIVFIGLDKISEALKIPNIEYFRAGHLIADDWRDIEPLFLSSLGASPYQQRRIYACLKDNKQAAALPAKEFFSKPLKPMCHKAIPQMNNFLFESFTLPGNFVTNVIYNLMTAGMANQNSFLENLHHMNAYSRMALVALIILDKKVSPENVNSFLNEMPALYNNPITEKPFLWDEEGSFLYYINPREPDLQPFVFRVRTQ